MKEALVEEADNVDGEQAENKAPININERKINKEVSSTFNLRVLFSFISIYEKKCSNLLQKMPASTLKVNTGVNLVYLQALLWLSMDTSGSFDDNNEDFEKMKDIVKNTFYEDEQDITGEFSTN